MSHWKKYFELLGLSGSETNVYLSVLKSGPETVQNISKNTNLSRVTVYSAIEALSKHGLMTSVEKGKKQFYAAEPAERILNLAENRSNQITDLISQIKDNLNELKMIESGDKPVVKMYDGVEAFTVIQEDVVKSNATRLCEFGNIDEIDRIYPYGQERRKKYFEKLANKKTERQLIFLTKGEKVRASEPNKKVKFLPDNINFNGDIFIYGDKIWLSNFKDKQLTVMIQSKELKETLQVMFDLIWNKLP